LGGKKKEEREGKRKKGAILQCFLSFLSDVFLAPPGFSWRGREGGKRIGGGGEKGGKKRKKKGG